MNWYEDHILPRIIDWTMSHREVMKIREKFVTGLEGKTLEVGFGSGLNLPFMPEAVTRLIAVDPAKLGRKLAKKRLAQFSRPVDFIDLEPSGRLPLEDSSVDSVLSTFTLCTIADLNQALEEILRVLKPGGRLVFVEHGLSPEPHIQKWQMRINPCQKCIGGGCHLNRKIDDFIANVGFDLVELNNFYAKGPKPWSYLYQGWARKPFGN
ncbi:MAG: class I SAM-dependent methyltransferase [Bdellovibrionaceae bacterium]|nr:class I SAM-dependent methyltransferase [Bdellovibrionales bacterium]MCB9085046.1 class I SAM-dependent methyltransferase [Pseudobdellovibrionaceae bacterium]